MSDYERGYKDGQADLNASRPRQANLHLAGEAYRLGYLDGYAQTQGAIK